ncbi:Proteinase inhibitor [Trema orientale]|uniref:Proteinase inhibitor n=2 Tax=Cannabaceae TaxID=3481 RepID=A0A2P5A599_PARAD|nr:Proteinase inhibitor [Parasponia andersonii]PON95050.1 Proteinase inhibitor [Trema orientale]
MASDFGCPGKNSWPELVGVNGQEAARTIDKENKNVAARVVREGTFVTQDFRCDRVWVWVNDYNIVTRVPHVG